jgi:hypothetical protein
MLAAQLQPDPAGSLKPKAFITIPGTDHRYGLISFDADGKEREESDGFMSRKLLDLAAADSITNVFFFCHGWLAMARVEHTAPIRFLAVVFEPEHWGADS